MAASDNSTKHICYRCIGDQFLSDEVKGKGLRTLCSYCGKQRKALTLDDLADRMHGVMEEHFNLTPDHPDEPYEFFMFSEGRWERRGEEPEIVIEDLVELPDGAAADLASLLSSRHMYQAAKDGEENPYGSEAMYEEKPAQDLGFRLIWAEFRREIRTRSRFLNAVAEDLLTEIFGDLNALKTLDDRPVIKQINPADQCHFVWRGRTAKSTQELESILKSPVQELGPPPPKSAKGGRMNAQGISVFYGAMEESTCVSELRPPVGSSVVIGRFGLLRTLTLLDLGALAEVYVKASHFDPHYPEHKSRAIFLRRLVREISQPIVFEDDALEHLMTQVVTEYLAYKATPRVDGIIYPSSQTDGTGNNVVLFNRSRGVEPYDFPAGSIVKVSLPSRAASEPDEDYDNTIFVLETVPSKPAQEESTTQEEMPPHRSLRGFDVFLERQLQDEEEEDNGPTLRLDLESVVVLNIEAVHYDVSSSTVLRHRQTEEERDALDRRLDGTVTVDETLIEF